MGGMVKRSISKQEVMVSIPMKGGLTLNKLFPTTRRPRDNQWLVHMALPRWNKTITNKNSHVSSNKLVTSVKHLLADEKQSNFPHHDPISIRTADWAFLQCKNSFF